MVRAGRCAAALLAAAGLSLPAWSRNRQALWHKGGTSGLVQRVVELRMDDDEDALWLRVRLQDGRQAEPASCHVGYRSCFYRGT